MRKFIKINFSFFFFSFNIYIHMSHRVSEQLHQLVKNCVKLCKMEKGDHFTQYEQKKDPHQFGQTCV